ncbi:MAG: MraY family glycosyltransferase [Elusimicrobiota bacterium]
MVYFKIFIISLVLGLVLTPLFRFLAVRFNIYDKPITSIKTHKIPVPYLGGLAVYLAFVLSMLILRYFTSFPTGTLRSLRGILFGLTFITIVGLVDDIKHGGLGYKVKFVWQILAACMLLMFDIRIKFIQPDYLADIITIVWVVGVTNALNIIDIMDGLSSGVAAISALSFFFIALPGEDIYVNFASVIMAGACIGFMPYNMSKKLKIFLGDTGALGIGFVLAALSLSTTYTNVNPIAVYVPLLILGIPLFDTVYVSILRIQQGKSPFLGSKDHLALRLTAAGLSRVQVVFAAVGATMFIGFCAWVVTRVQLWYAIGVYVFVILLAVLIGKHLSKYKME